MKLDNNIKEIFKTVKEVYGSSSDIVTRTIIKNKEEIGYIYIYKVLVVMIKLVIF